MRGAKKKSSNNGTITRAKVSHVVCYELPNGQVAAVACTSRVQAVKRQAREQMFNFILTARQFAKWIGEFDVDSNGAVAL